MHDEQTMMTPTEMHEILRKARETYGNRNQLMVSIEELNELACVLAKYPRYEDDTKATKELYDKALDEVADVYTILEHVKAIFNISEEALWRRRIAKTLRVNQWIQHSNSMTETVKDRAVQGETCENCQIGLHITPQLYDEKCVNCLKAQATEGKAPYKIIKE